MLTTIGPRTRALAAVASLLAVATVGCTGSDDAPSAAATPTPTTSATPSDLSVAVASFDLAVGEDRRFIAGLFTAEREVVLGGEIAMRFFYLGEDGAGSSPEALGDATTGTFLAVPGKEPAQQLDAPTVLPPADAAGVYETSVDLEQPGFYGVAVQVQLADGTVQQATANFEVSETPAIPQVGDPAPTAANRTVDSDAPLAAIDSRARGEDAQLPDPELHTAKVPEAVDNGRPLVVVVSTPTYCVSQFCGPITETTAELAEAYGDRADFVHLEVWQDFDDTVLNNAAAAWIQTGEGGSEPWVFYVGGDGTIEARWDNVLDETALVDLLDAS